VSSLCEASRGSILGRFSNTAILAVWWAPFFSRVVMTRSNSQTQERTAMKGTMSRSEYQRKQPGKDFRKRLSNRPNYDRDNQPQPCRDTLGIPQGMSVALRHSPARRHTAPGTPPCLPRGVPAQLWPATNGLVYSPVTALSIRLSCKCIVIYGLPLRVRGARIARVTRV
jgi:hypothetical protein